MAPLKEHLKRVRALRAANANIKSTQLHLQRAWVRSAYERRAVAAGITYDADRVPARMRSRLHARGIDLSGVRVPRVLWVGADLQQDRGGFLQSLERHADVTSFVRASGSYGLQTQSLDGTTRRHDPAVVRANDAQLLRLVDDARRSGRPYQVLIGQMWAHLVSAATLRAIQSSGVATVNVAMDDRLPEHWLRRRGHRMGSVGLAGGLDLVLTTSPECCLWYEVEGCDSLWWPLASDPAVFQPAPEDSKRYDVSFVGRRYGVRDRMVTALARAGVHVDAFGPFWPAGSIAADQVAAVFAQSRIILGVGTVAHTDRVYTLKLRDFDAPMAGSLYITHRNPDLLRLFEEGTEIECYESEAELVEKVRHYLATPAQRVAVAEAGRERALRDHTWDSRLTALFDTLCATGAG